MLGITFSVDKYGRPKHEGEEWHLIKVPLNSAISLPTAECDITTKIGSDHYHHDQFCSAFFGLGLTYNIPANCVVEPLDLQCNAE